ncbi:COG3113 Predicted NTP binding protein (contains STAS domain) [Burkholderiaceae bacterium]
MSFALALPERVTLAEATQVLSVLESGLPDTAVVQLDASALQTFDSSVVAVLLALQRRLATHGQRLQVCQRSERLQALLTLYGVDELLPA